MKKYLFCMIVAVLVNNLVYGSIECKRDGRWWYPVSADAIKIAKSLGVKTCNGKRFRAVVKSLGVSSNIKSGTKRMSVEDVVKSMKSN